MMLRFVLATMLCVFSSISVAQMNLTGKIHTIHPNMKANFIVVHLEGAPVFNGGGCTSKWAGATLDDEKFKSYFLPILLASNAMKEEVRISVEGCIPHAAVPGATYPKIIGIDSKVPQ